MWTLVSWPYTTPHPQKWYPVILGHVAARAVQRDRLTLGIQNTQERVTFVYPERGKSTVKSDKSLEFCGSQGGFIPPILSIPRLPRLSAL